MCVISVQNDYLMRMKTRDLVHEINADCEYLQVASSAKVIAVPMVNHGVCILFCGITNAQVLYVWFVWVEYLRREFLEGFETCF